MRELRQSECSANRQTEAAEGALRLSSWTHPMFHRRSPAPAQDSSWLLLPAEPYYNPVNLEKARTRVKQKEFLALIKISGPPAAAAHQRSGPQARDLLFRLARMGSPGPGFAAAHPEPLPHVYRSRRAPAAARHFPAPRARPES